MFWHANTFTTRKSHAQTAPALCARRRVSPCPRCPQVECLERRTLLSAGDLDPTFGTGGKVTTDFGSVEDDADGVVIQSGKIVAAGSVFTGYVPGSEVQPGHRDFALARYNANGSLDGSFGTGGKVITSWGTGRHADAHDIALQSDDKLVAIGEVCKKASPPYGASCNGSTLDFALVRYKPNGALDKAFGTNGKVVTDFGSGERANAGVIDPNLRIVVGGTNFKLARFNTNGSLDSTFGSGGKVTTPTVGGTEVRSIAIDSQERIIAAGDWVRTCVEFDVMGACIKTLPTTAIVRYNTDGTLDSTFGTAGIVTTVGFTTGGVRIQGDGKIVVAGGSDFNNLQATVFVARYNADGTLDQTFGPAQTGIVETDLRPGNDVATDLVIQTNGKIVVVGGADTDNFGQSTDFAVVRYNPDGTLDNSFGTGGIVTSNILGTDTALAVALQSDDKIVAVGKAGPSRFVQDFAIARYLGDPPLLAASTPAHPRSTTISALQAQPLLLEALTGWQAAGVDTFGLGDIQLQITNLGGRTLGTPSGRTIWLDDNAAGGGWFVDAAPEDDSEYTTPGNQGEQGHMDLLTAIAHEVGHLLGFEHSEVGVMDDTLDTGVRTMPAAATAVTEPAVVDSVIALDWTGEHHRQRHDVLDSMSALIGRSNRFGLSRWNTMRR